MRLERVALFYTLSTPPAIVILLLCRLPVGFFLLRLRPACFFLLSSIVPHGMRVCRSSAALCVSIASPSISPAFNAGIFFVSYAGYYPALYSLYCEPVAVPVGVSFFFSPTSDVGFCCPVRAISVSAFASPLIPSEIHHSPDRAMSGRQPRQKDDDFSGQKFAYFKKISVPLHRN